MPYIGPSGELKTKPTQHSVAALRQVGIQPDAIVCRADRELPASIKRKIALMCDVDDEAVVTAADAPSIYDIPKVLHREGLDAYLVRRLDLPFRDVDWTLWDDLLRRVHHPEEEVTVALVGKYVDLPDAYLSVAEALRAGGFAHEAKVNLRWVASDECATPAGAAKHLGDVDAVCVPGGFGIRGIEGKLGALTYTRTHGIPTLGLCLGLQCMVIEYTREVLGLGEGRLHRVRPGHHRAGHRDDGRAGRHRRRCRATSVARCAWGSTRPSSRRAPSSVRRTAPPRSRSATGTATRSTTPTARTSRRPVWSSPGPRPDNNLVEFVELPREVHPYYVATQAHPEYRSRPTRPHPLFAGLVGAAIARQRELRFPIDETGLRRRSADDQV